MKAIINNLVILLISCLFSSLLFAQDIQSFEVNGLKVIFKENSANDIISTNLYFKGGVTNLNQDQAGLESLTLTVAIDASENYPKDMLNAELESINTILTTGSNFDYSRISLLCVKQNFEKSWNIFSDVILNPAFDEQDLTLERERQIAAVKQVNDNPDALLQKLVNNEFYEDHPYSIEVSGTENTLSSFTVNDLKNYYSKLLNTSQMLLVVVGNTTKDELESMVKNSFGNIPEGNYVPKRPPTVVNSEPSVKVVHRELPTNYIQGTYSAPERGTTEGFTMLIANSILRDRLFEEVRTKRSLSYAPSSFYRTNFSNYGAIYVTAVEPDTTIKVMIHELQRMKDEPIPEKELQNKIRQFLTFYYLGNETNQSQANGLASYELAGFGYKEAANFINNLSKVTAADIQAVAQKYMKNLQFVLIGNPAELEIKSFMY
jgi:zinc protease